jgi:hypothetical protein
MRTPFGDMPLQIVCNPFQNKFLERYHAGGYRFTMKHLDLRHALTSLPTAARLVQATVVCALLAWAIRSRRPVVNDCDSLRI